MPGNTLYSLVLTSSNEGVDSASTQAYSILLDDAAQRGTYHRPAMTLQGLKHWACEFMAQRKRLGEVDFGPLLERLRTAEEIARHPIDVNIVRDGADRRKRLLIADMESTIIEQEMLDELGDFIGARARIEEITARAMRGELDFEAALDERVGLLKGLDASVLDEVAKRITLMPGAETLVATMKANGAYCALISGGFTVFTSRVAKQLGFDEHRANVLEIADGKLTGRVIRPILGTRSQARGLAGIDGQARTSARARPSPSATAPTISPCSARPGSASPSAPSRRFGKPPPPCPMAPSSRMAT